VKLYGILQVKVACISLCTRSAPFAVLLSQTTLLPVASIGAQAVFPKECSECTASTDTFCARDGNLCSCGMLTSVVCPLDHTLCACNVGRQADFIPKDFFLLGLQGNVERYVPGARHIQREPVTGEYRSHHQKVWIGFCLRHVTEPNISET